MIHENKLITATLNWEKSEMYCQEKFKRVYADHSSHIANPRNNKDLQKYFLEAFIIITSVQRLQI
jgi:hypothetical protein